MRRRRNSETPQESPSVQEGDEATGTGKVQVVEVRVVIWMCLGLVVGTICGGMSMRNILDRIYGYRWDSVRRCIIENEAEEGYGADFCRLPVDCEVCEDVDAIDDVSVDSISVDMFEEKYAYTNRPLVVRNASLNWKAMEVVNYNWLREVYLSDENIFQNGTEACWFNHYKTKEFTNLRAVFRLLGPTGVLKTSKTWYVGWSVCHEQVAKELSKLVQPPTFMNRESTTSKMPWIFIGTPGPGVRFHMDKVDLPSWQAQLAGVKKWYLKPPPECFWSCPGKMETTLYPGDMIVVNSNIWYHQTEVLGSDNSVVITSEFD